MIKEIIVYAALPFLNNKAYKEAISILDLFKQKSGIQNIPIFELNPTQLEYYKNFYDDIKEFPVILVWLQEITNENSTTPDYTFYLNTDLDRQTAKKWLSDYVKNPSGKPAEATTRFICNDAGKIITLKKGDVGFDTAYDDAGQAQASCKAAETKSTNFNPLVLGGAIALGAFLFFKK